MLVKTENLTMTYNNGCSAVKNLNLNVEDGDIFGLLGATGSGKTTTIRLIAGLLKPTNGKTIINNYETVAKDIKKIIGVVSESNGFYNWMTGEEYLGYFAGFFKKDRIITKRHIEYLLEKFSLMDKKNCRVGTYSRVMRRKLCMAKALVNGPKLILMDEPTLGLDLVEQEEIQKLILEINKIMNVTVLIASPLINDIEVLCNRIGVIEKGELVEQGTLQRLLYKYSENEVIKLRTTDNRRAGRFFEGNKMFTGLELKEDYLYIYMDKNLYSYLMNEARHYIVEKLFINSIDILEMGRREITLKDVYLKVTAPREKGQMLVF